MKRKHFWIILILSLFLLVQFFYALQFHDVSWDESVYLGMGKFLYSGGETGLWEIIRPIVMPLFFGLFWFLGLPLVFAAELLEILFAAGILLFVYLIGKKVWSKEAGIVAALLLAVTPVFFLYSGYLLTGIPSAFFALVGIYYLLSKSPVAGGAFLGLAAVTRFPTGIFFGIAFLCFLGFKKRKETISLVKGFFIPIVPFLLFNYFMYRAVTGKLWHALFRPWILASTHQFNPAEFVNERLFYFGAIWENNFLLYLCVLGLVFYFVKKEFNFDKTVVVASLVIPFIYFSSIGNQQIRFTLVFLPFAVLLASAGLWQLCNWVSFKKEAWQTAVGVLVIVLLLFVVPTDYGYYNWRGEAPTLVTEFYPLLDEVEEGMVLTADPVVAAYVDRKFEPYYFSIDVAQKIFAEQGDAAVAILHISDAFFCAPEDIQCAEAVDEFDVSAGMELAAQTSYGEREFYLYRRR